MTSTPAPVLFRERLWPSAWAFIVSALVMPASLLVFLPISVPAGIVTAIGFYLAIVAGLVLTTPTIEVDDSRLRAGSAEIPRELIAEAHPHRDEEAGAERGPRLDARAWLLLRGWISPVVRIQLDDPSDPTPYWLVSSRRPEELAAALTR